VARQHLVSRTGSFGLVCWVFFEPGFCRPHLLPPGSCLGKQQLVSARGVHATHDYRLRHSPSQLPPRAHSPATALLAFGCPTAPLDPLLVSVCSLLLVEVKGPELLFSFVLYVLVSWSSWQIILDFCVKFYTFSCSHQTPFPLGQETAELQCVILQKHHVRVWWHTARKTHQMLEFFRKRDCSRKHHKMTALTCDHPYLRCCIDF